MTSNLGIYIAFGSTIFLGIGLLLNWKAIRENNITIQLKLLNDCFKDIKKTELLLYEKYKENFAKLTPPKSNPKTP